MCKIGLIIGVKIDLCHVGVIEWSCPRIVNAELILISGDIAEAPSVCELLSEMALTINKSIYFVLGNHDYYFGNIAAVRDDVIQLKKKQPLLNWLSIMKPVLLKEGVFLVGQVTLLKNHKVFPMLVIRYKWIPLIQTNLLCSYFQIHP